MEDMKKLQETETAEKIFDDVMKVLKKEKGVFNLTLNISLETTRLEIRVVLRWTDEPEQTEDSRILCFILDDGIDSKETNKILLDKLKDFVKNASKCPDVEKHLREIDDGENVLCHEVYVDDFGIKKNRLRITNKKNGLTEQIFAPLRVRDYSPSDSLDDDIRPYTDEEYRQIMSGFKNKVK